MYFRIDKTSFVENISGYTVKRAVLKSNHCK